MISNNALSTKTLDRLIPKTKYDLSELEMLYPVRQLQDGAKVTRIAPSPTGSMHIGGLYATLVSERIAHQTGGVFFLRIEDTDRKREKPGAKELIIKTLNDYGIDYDEGPSPSGIEHGKYGPYEQSSRSEIYKTYVRFMLESGLAYPCFLTSDELDNLTRNQHKQKIRPGYYGNWAIWRDRSEQDVISMLDKGKEFVIRYRSTGNQSKKIKYEDLVRGQRELPENDNDIVLLKRDGLPTYHLAHVIDDHLMRTTTVIRGDEWIASLPLHIQLAKSLSFEPFEYAHIAPIQKADNQSRRKLSKRKDPEANIEYYDQQGYPNIVVIEYLLNQANSNFEEWRLSNPDLGYQSFPFNAARLPKNGGALLNLSKLDDMSQRYLGGLSVSDLYSQILGWAKKYDKTFAEILVNRADYAKLVFSVERSGKNSRKDLITLSQSKYTYGFFFDEIFNQSAEELLASNPLNNISPNDVRSILEGFISSYNELDDQDEWFIKIKDLGESLNYTPNMKEFRKNPDAFKGSVADIAMVIRVSITGRNQSPNLYEVMKIMGKNRVFSRLDKIIQYLDK